MNRKSILSALLCLSMCLVSLAQNRSVALLHDTGLDRILQQAQEENKLGFLVFGSPRCSPCLWMKKKVFTIDSIADFYNKHFVSADFMEGDEKKRLSKIYEVHTEPVYLIIDAEGNLIHRMEGKCSAEDFMKRTRQGLDIDNNLMAQNKIYDVGHRDIDFLMSYIETLRVAGLNSKQEIVLKDIAGAIPVENLREKKYWDIFVKYNQNAVSPENLYVCDHLNEFYELYGETAVNAKIDLLFGAATRIFIYGHSAPADSEQFNKLLAYMKEFDYKKSTEWLAYLMPAQYKFKDWGAMVGEIQDVIDLNLFRGDEKKMYMKMMAQQVCWYSDDKAALKHALNWIDYLVPKSDEKTKESLLETRKMIDGKLLK